MNQKVEKYDNQYVNKFCLKYIIFSALTGDLIFLAIVDTLFLTIVKNLNASQITLLISIPAAIGIVVQPYVLKIIHKVGNTSSIRIGSLSLLISCLLITFGTSYLVLVIGKLFYEISFVFLNMQNIILENNLKQVGREKQYVHVRNKSSIAYAVITAMIAFMAGYLFNIHSYLPMILNIVICLGCFILSFSMKDISKNDTISECQRQSVNGKMSMIVYIAIISYAFFYTAVSVGQSNSKLFIQYQLGNYFDSTLTATYLGMIISLSRITRIISNIIFDKIYKILKDKINIMLASVFILAFLFIIVGNFITSNLYLKFGCMIAGFCIILSVRDPFKIYIQDLILRVTEPEKQQAIMANLELAKKIGQTIIGFVVSAVLLKFSMIYVIVGIGLIALMSLKTTIRLFEVVRRSNKLVDIL